MYSSTHTYKLPSYIHTKESSHWYTLTTNLGCELVYSLRGYAPSSESRQSVQPGVVPVSHNPSSDEFLYLSLGDDGVLKVEPAILPLYWAVEVQRVAQPVVG